MAITAVMRTQVSQLYVALFGRAPDSDGLGYWVTQLGNGTSLTSVADTMYATAPARAYYPTWKTNQEIIEAFYLNVLGRAADSEGLAYWTAKLNATGATPGSVIAEMINVVANYAGTDAAGVKSAALFNNKADVAQTYAEAGGTIANATSILAGVTEAAATVTAAKATISSGGATSAAGQTYDMTASVETASGTAGDDIFNGSTTDSGQTLNTGDVINGGSGSDTLRITSQGQSPIIQLNSVETVDIRMLSASQSLNAISWSGTTQVNVNNTSIDDSTLTITNASQSTQFRISDDANIVVEYLDDSGSSDTARLFVDVGGVSGSPATFTISATEAVNLGVSGAAFVAVSAGDTALKDVSVSGVGTLNFQIAETSLSGLSLAGFSGSSDITIGAASDLNVTGGAGNDVIRFGTTFNGSDTVNGGAGTDTITAALAGVVSFTRVSNVETGTFAATGTTVIADLNGASFSTINLAPGSADTSVQFNNIGNVEFNVSGLAFEALNLDYSGTNANIDLVAPAAATYSAISITDASGISLSRDAGGSGTHTISSLTLDSDARSLSIDGFSGNTVVTAFDGGGITSIALTAGASGAVSVADAANAVGSSLTSVSLSAQGASATLALGNLSLNTGVATISAAASGVAAALDLDNIQTSKSGTTTLNLSLAGSGATMGVGQMTMGGSGTTNLNVTLGADTTFSAGDVVGLTSAAASMVVNFAVSVGASSLAGFGDLELGSAAANGSTVLDLDFSVGASGDLTVGSAFAASVAGVSGSLGNAATATIAFMSGLEIGDIVLSGSGKMILSDVRANSGIASINNIDGTLAMVATASTVGNISLAGDASTVTLNVSKSIGNVAITGSGGATVLKNGSASFGTITVGGHGTVLVDVGDATGVGAVSTVGHSGQVTLVLTSAADQQAVTLGAGSNDVYVSLAGNGGFELNGDLISLQAGTGSDGIHFAASGNQDAIVTNFQLASSTDQLVFGTAGFTFGLGSATTIANDAPGNMTVQVVSDSGPTATVALATDVIILQSATYGSLADMLSAISDGGSRELQGATAAEAGNDLLIAWQDTNGSTHVTLVNVGATAAAGAALFSAGVDTDEMVLLQDVGISTFSGTSWTDKFQHE